MREPVASGSGTHRSTVCISILASLFFQSRSARHIQTAGQRLVVAPSFGGFANRGYGWLCIYLDGKLVHRTGIFPRYFRFPFMKRDELLFGDIWTDPKCRRRGLARYAVTSILHAYPNADYWYLVREENDASIKLAQGVGFELVATGVRTRRFGHSIFGRFEIRPVQDDSA